VSEWVYWGNLDLDPEYDTDQVARLFNMGARSETHHPKIVGMWVSGSGSGRLFMSWDHVDPQQTKIDVGEVEPSQGGHVAHNLFRMDLLIANQTHEFMPADGIDIFNKLAFLNVSAISFDLTIEFEVVAGGMDFGEENANRIGQITQVSVERHAGGQFFQPNSKWYRQLAGPNS